MTVRFVDDDGQESYVNEHTGEVTEDPSGTSATPPAARTDIAIRWDRVISLITAVVLCVAGFATVWGMLHLLTEPLPPCTSVTIQHTCSGEP